MRIFNLYSQGFHYPKPFLENVRLCVRARAKKRQSRELSSFIKKEAIETQNYIK